MSANPTIHQITTTDGTTYDLMDAFAREQLLNKLEKVVVAALPMPSQIDPTTMANKIYLVPRGSMDDPNTVYDAYVIAREDPEDPNSSYRWVHLGSTAIDLSGYSLQGHTHQVTPHTEVGDHVFYIEGTLPTLTFTGTSSSFSGATGTIESGDVSIQVNNATGQGTSYTPEGSVGGQTESAGSHTHNIKKVTKYLKKKTLDYGVESTTQDAAAMITATASKHFVFATSATPTKTAIHKITVGAATSTNVNITASSAVKRADGTLEAVAQGNDSKAIVTEATVSNGVLSFTRKQMHTEDTFGGIASATVNIPTVSDGGSINVYEAEVFSIETKDYNTLSTFSAAIKTKTQQVVADYELAESSAASSVKGDPLVAEVNAGTGSGDTVATDSGGSHSHTLETKSGGVTWTGTEKKFKGSIDNGTVSGISGSVTPQGTVSYDAQQGVTQGHFKSEQVTLTHTVYNPTVITSPDDDGINHVTDWYGISYNELTDTAPANNTRIGNMTYHKTLPIHSAMRRCLLLDNGEVNYYLDPNDSTKKMDGTAADLSGADGMVMVEVPRHWRYVHRDDETNDVVAMVSPYEQEGWVAVPKYYISAYEATIDRTTDTEAGKKLASVVNTTAAFRGGNNTSAWDETDKTLLGRPATATTMANFRKYARNRGTSGEYKWNILPYDIYIDLYWLYVIEYANRNSQAAFNASLTSEGYKQGGLGAGVTNLNSDAWNAWNSYNPFVPCGATNSLGNNTGTVTYTLPEGYGSSLKTDVPSWRGIENPFGHIFKFADGIKYNNQHVYRTDNPADYSSDESQGNYVDKGTKGSSNGYVGKLLLGTDGDISPVDVTGGSTSKYCDYYYQANADKSGGWNGKTTYCCLLGGRASRGAYAGLAFVLSDAGVSGSHASYGSRLCFCAR